MFQGATAIVVMGQNQRSEVCKEQLALFNLCPTVRSMLQCLGCDVA